VALAALLVIALPISSAPFDPLKRDIGGSNSISVG
jgi:hypothetical protein